MTKEEMRKRYFDWMCDLVYNPRYFKRVSYSKLFELLANTEFVYILDMDGNRFEDGISLRYRFGYECNIDQRSVALYLDNEPCSVLEMLVALSLRCEEHIMDDPEVGNRTGQWFWNMIVTLGLGSMTDEKFDEEKASDILTTFLNRQYAPDGEGGLFRIQNCPIDLREVEIWYQMMWYLNGV